MKYSRKGELYGIKKKSAAVFLATVMAVTGIPAGGLVLQTEAAPNTDGNAYLGVMLTKDEFNRISYTNADVDWCDYVPEEEAITFESICNAELNEESCLV